jgi:hypothetical protein
MIKNILIDLVDYMPHYWKWCLKDFQIITNYIDIRQFSIKIIPLNLDDINYPDLQLLLCQLDSKKNLTGITQRITYPSNTESIIVTSNFDLEKDLVGSQEIFLPYKLVTTSNYEASILSREEFNREFNSDIVQLPHDIYAVGLKNDWWYVYSETMVLYWDSIPIMRYILHVALTYFREQSNNLYFLISVHDGYLEHHYPSIRNKPKIFSVGELRGKIIQNELLELSEYPVLYNKKYVLAQSNHKNVDYTLNTLDRHYFLCNMYNSFRSIHNGLSFRSKINKIVYACRYHNSSKYNYTVRRDIDIQQRAYFYSNNVPKDNIVCERGLHIPDTEMVKYKYILNIDGT